jgi:hypothetical protein
MRLRPSIPEAPRRGAICCNAADLSVVYRRGSRFGWASFATMACSSLAPSRERPSIIPSPRISIERPLKSPPPAPPVREASQPPPSTPKLDLRSELKPFTSPSPLPKSEPRNAAALQPDQALVANHPTIRTPPRPKKAPPRQNIHPPSSYTTYPLRKPGYRPQSPRITIVKSTT